MSEQNADLVQHFLQYFTVSLALTPEQKREAFRIRYRVYCEEFEYEPAERFPEGLEHDEYDDHAINCVIRHISSGMPASCVRMVPSRGDKTTFPLPFEKNAAGSLDQAFFQSVTFGRDTVCEISRLAVDGAFRRRSGEAASRFGEVAAMNLEEQEKRTFGLLGMASFLCATAITELTGRTNVFAMMEPYLPRMLKKSGIEFAKVGKEIDYHGLRAPYFSRTEQAVKGMRPELNSLYEAIYGLIKNDFIEDFRDGTTR